MGFTVYNSAGAEVWNSDTVAGGVIADVKTYAPADTGTLIYPSFAGRSVFIVSLLTGISAGTLGVTVDYGPGYPRVTVSVTDVNRRFAVVVL